MEFKVWAPLAASVELVAHDSRYVMESRAHGWWHTEVEGIEAGEAYRYAIDGGEPMPDPRSGSQAEGVKGASYVVDHSAFQWAHNDFKPGPIAAAVIYELHIGTITEAGSFEAAIEKLDHLADLGITHVEVMPIAEFPGSRGWGYDGVDLFAPLHAYGSPDSVKHFVDACHGKGMAVMLDVVYNHLGPDGNYLGSFGSYFTSTYATPWGSAVNLDDAGSTEVRRFFIDNALMWLRDYHFDGLRLDAVHSVVDRSAIHFLEQLSTEVDELSLGLGREFVVVAESDLNDPRLVWSRERGGYGLHAAWSDDFHHAVHTVLTGENHGYYSDFGSISDIAKALIDVYIYDGKYSEFRQRTHGRAIGDIPPRRFIVASQNHDQIGNRAQGERLEHLVGPAAAKIAAALTLTSASIPMLFQGEEWAASTPFQYFTDHQDRKLGKAVSEGRKREFGWSSGEIPDPQDVATFQQSKLNWAEIGEASHAEMLDWYRRLIAFRKEHAQMLVAPVTGLDIGEDESWLAISRGNAFHLVVNFSRDKAVAVPVAPDVEIALTSGGTAVNEGTLLLPPLSVACLVSR